MRTNFIKRKNKMILKQSFMLLLSLLVMFSGMIPSIAATTANELELPSLEEPKVSKDVEGTDYKELITGEDFTYHIQVVLPKDLTGYEHMEILDNLNNNLTLQETSILINGNATDALVATEEGQVISLKLHAEQLEELAGNELVLQITAQVKEDATVGESIENIAQVLINDTVEIATNSVLITPINSEATEKEEEVVNNSNVAEAKEEDRESKLVDTNTQTNETTNVDEEASKEPKKDSEAEEAVKKSEVATAQQQDAEGITINDTDIYLIGSGHILQLDGNDPSIEKGRVQLDNSSITNSLALGKNEDVFYANAALRLYKIYPDGKTEFVTDLEGDLSPPAGAISPDGKEYVYLSRSAEGQLSISSYNLSTGEKNNVPIEDKSGFVDLSGGDFAFDGEGNLWFSRWNDSPPNSALAKVDTQTGILESVIPVISETGEPFSRSGSLSFLPNGKLLIQGNYMPGSHLFELNPATGVAREIVSTDKFGLGLQDAASRVYPVINPEVEIIKSVSPTETVSHGEELTYTLKIQNSGNLASTLTTVTDELPEGTTYVPHSTTLNGQDVEDENGESPLFTGMLVNSPNETLEGVLYAGEDNAAIVTFKVTVDESVPSGTEILNVASVSYDGESNIPSNEVTNIVEEIIPPNSCAVPVALVNGSFEEGPENGSYNGSYMFLASEVPGWDTTDDSQGVEIIEIWNYEQNFPGVVRDFPAPPDGNRYAELNAYENGLLYQDVETTPGQTIYWRLSHMGRQGVDTMQVRIGPATDNPYDTEVQTQMSTGNTAWETYTGTYTVPAGQTVTRFGFEAVNTASEDISVGNFLDDIFLGTEPCVDTEKSVSPEGEVYAGEELTYEITVKNSGGDVAADMVIEDEIPEGTEYVPGSMKILNGPESGDLTDEDDEDAGHYADGKVTFNIGDLPNTTNMPEGVTVQFKVITLNEHAGKVVVNEANVKHKNLLTDEDHETPTNETETPVKYKDPELDSKKSVELKEKAEGNMDEDNPEVGDTLRYTITTSNVIEGSLVENLTIRDTIPEGLTYVEGSLEVDGVSVTDEEDDDAGHAVDGAITGNFGDIADTDQHTVTFLVTVDEGQAGKDIKNVAVVEGTNSPPDEPEEEIKIYPRDPVLEAEKLAVNAEAGKEKFEVGDTIIYTIQTRNTVSDSLVEDLVITDELPAGLTFVEGSIEVSHDGEAEFTEGTITANFGDIEDTEWRTVTFEAVIESGQSGKEIENTAQITSNGTEDPEDPTTTTIVDPKDPQLESAKSSSIEEKAEGNTDVDNPEVGDTLRYTITTQNTIEDSLVENLVITDEIPEGLTYVPDSLEVDGVSVTDEEDDDAGHAVDGAITGNFGDIADTDQHTVTFLVTVDEGQAGKDIKNVAIVEGTNTPPDKPEKDTKIYPRDPVLEAEKLAVNAEVGKEKFEVGDTIIYTIQTRNTVSDSLVEDLVITDELPAGLAFVEGSIEVSHDGEAEFADGVITANFGDVEDTEWRTVTFEAIIESGQSEKTIENTATVEGKDVPPIHPGTETKIDPKDPELSSDKSAVIEEKAEGNTDVENPEVGDTLRYTITTQNTVEDSLVENLVIADTIPKGLTYVPGSLEVDGVSVTDEEDDDTGHAIDGEITGNFGNITDTDKHTVTFLVTVDEGQAGQDIINIAMVKGNNTGVDEPEEEVEIFPRNPMLESEKSAENLEKGKDYFEVGDTIVYTIKARNTVSDSFVENLTITDKLPAGIEYVEGSLEVSHEGAGKFKDGTITASFGDVTDQEWYTITFQATINTDQSGKTIKNVAKIDADNVTEPNQAEANVLVEEKDSITTPPEKADPPANGEKEEGQKLPKTATNTFNFMLLGIMTVLVGLITMRIRKTNEQ